MNDLDILVAEKTLGPPPLDVSGYVEAIRERYGDKLLGVFMYGSMLSSVTATATSFPDFFVITDGYAGVFNRASHRLSAYPLPPHIFHLRLDEKRHCKYNLLSISQFERETSHRARDIYILGRFGKRVSLLYARDDDARQRLVQCCASAMRAVAAWTLVGMDHPFDAQEFCLACLNISYAGETRVETDSKVPCLYQANSDFYDQVYPRLLTEMAKSSPTVVSHEDGHYQPTGNAVRRWLRRRVFSMFLRRSRWRGIMRWPKFLLTVDEWVDIILAKIERTKGIRIEPTPRQRRHPLLFGWPHFFRLLRQGAIRSSKTKSLPKDEDN